MNDESIKILRSKMAALVSSQKARFDDEIKALKARNAAAGKFKSGGTIKESARIIETFIEERKLKLINQIEDLPFQFDSDLEEKINDIQNKYLPPDYDDFRAEFLKILEQVAPSEAAHNAGLELIDASNGRIRNELTVELNKYYLLLRHKSKNDKLSRYLLFMELILWLITAFLAGMWASDPDGNYEPWIVIVALIASGIDIYRRFSSGRA